MTRFRAGRRMLTVVAALSASLIATTVAPRPASALPATLTAPAPALEGAAGTPHTVAFTIRLPQPAVGTEKVTVATVAGTASHGDVDYTIVKPRVIAFTAGQRTRTISVQVNGDDKPEADETFSLRFSSPVNIELPAVTTVTTTILDDDSRLNIADAQVTESTGGPVTINFPVTTALQFRSSCSYSATLSHGSTLPADFVSTSTVIVTHPVSGSSTVTFEVSGDTLFEGPESFTVTIAGVGAAPCAIGQAVATGTIADDDAPPPPISVADVAQLERNNGSFQMLFQVSGFTVSCGYRVAVDFGTTDAADFQVDTFPAPNVTQTLSGTFVRVFVLGDIDVESDEVFTMTFTGMANGTAPACVFADGTSQGTILDDDGPVLIFVDDLTVAEGAQALVPVRIEHAAGRFCKATFSTVPGTAAADVDYRTRVAAATFSPPGGTFLVLGLQDLLVEGPETYTLTAEIAPGEPAFCQIGDGSGTVTITDDEAATVSIADKAKLEGTGIDANIPFVVSTTGVLAAPCTYTATLTHGTTDAGDFTTVAAVTRTQPISGATTTVPFKMVGDAVVEPDEAFTVTIAGSGANPCQIADGTATGTIRNDD